MGAFSVDVTHSNVSIPDDKTYQGQSYRISWIFAEHFQHALSHGEATENIN
ncbi:hypothetical protein O5190_26850, partial [Escherichia coli]|nr:hypothetical protein [Escherichia coli]